MESLVNFWDLKPRLDLLSDRDEDEAYHAAKQGEAYVVYFPSGGSVKVRAAAGACKLHWIAIDTGEWGSKDEASGEEITLTAPGKGNWAAAVVR